MLPKPARMRNAKEFRDTVRRGVRTGRPTLIVHAGLSATGKGDRAAGSHNVAEVRVGFVVSKAVGNAVTRNRVKRRLRHLALQALPSTPAGSRIVVRALPRAATHPEEVATDLSKAWTRAAARLGPRTPEPAEPRRASK